MCMMVYLAADKPLIIVPWDDGNPSFHVVEIKEIWNHADAVRRQFTKPYVYYVGSHEGCGCGFQHGQYPEVETDPAELAACERSREALAAYLTTALSSLPAVELFACWDGDQAAVPEYVQRVTPNELRQRFFREKEILTVVPSHA